MKPIFALLFLLLAFGLKAADVILEWVPSASTTNVAGYNLYCGTADWTFNVTTNSVIGWTTTNTTISGLNRGTTYYFAATSFDGIGDESGFSNEAIYTVPAGPLPTLLFLRFK